MSDQPGAGALQRRVRRVCSPLVSAAWKLELQGYDRLPESGPAILCPNHISFLDSAFLMFTVPRNISFVGKAEYMDSWKTKFLFPAMGMIPIDRSGGEKSAAALDAARSVLERGELFGIFPEGTRSRNGNLHKGRTGAARLAMELDVPIFPVGITGTDDIQPPDAKLPKLRREATIEIGRAIKPSRYRNRGPEHLAWRSMMDEIMFEIAQMTGQRYVHHYAGESEAEPEVTGRVASVTELPPDDGDRDATGERELAVAAG